MHLIQITISIFPLAGMVCFAFVVGFLLRAAQLKDFRAKILDLEKEMLSNHAEILELQKEKASLHKQMKESKIPVIPLKAPADNEDDHGNTERRLGQSRNIL